MKQKKCKICSNLFTPRFKTTEFLCGPECALAYVRKQNEKKAKADWAKEKRVLKEKLKTKSDYEADLQVEINKIVKYIDAGYGCIATGSHEGKKNSGHYVSRGSNPTIRYHLFNIWNQSEHSNSWKSGDTLRYQEGIVKEFGKEMLDYMNSLQSIPPLKLSIEELKEKISLARSQVKWLQLQDRQFSKEERISLRKEINEKLGIYKF